MGNHVAFSLCSETTWTLSCKLLSRPNDQPRISFKLEHLLFMTNWSYCSSLSVPEGRTCASEMWWKDAIKCRQRMDGWKERKVELINVRGLLLCILPDKYSKVLWIVVNTSLNTLPNSFICWCLYRLLLIQTKSTCTPGLYRVMNFVLRVIYLYWYYFSWWCEISVR